MESGRNDPGKGFSIWSTFPCWHLISLSSPSAYHIPQFSGKLPVSWLLPPLFSFSLIPTAGSPPPTSSVPGPSGPLPGASF